MPVFDFNNTPEEGKISECTYTIFRTNESIANPEHPILVLDNKGKNLKHHSEGLFINPIKRTAFEFKEVIAMIFHGFIPFSSIRYAIL